MRNKAAMIWAIFVSFSLVFAQAPQSTFMNDVLSKTIDRMGAACFFQLLTQYRNLDPRLTNGHLRHIELSLEYLIYARKVEKNDIALNDDHLTVLLENAMRYSWNNFRIQTLPHINSLPEYDSPELLVAKKNFLRVVFDYLRSNDPTEYSQLFFEILNPAFNAELDFELEYNLRVLSHRTQHFATPEEQQLRVVFNQLYLIAHNRPRESKAHEQWSDLHGKYLRRLVNSNTARIEANVEALKSLYAGISDEAQRRYLDGIIDGLQF